MSTAILLFIIAGLSIVILFLAIVAAMFYYRNLKLEKQLDERIEFSINQGVEIMILQKRLGISDDPSPELMERLQKQLEDEDLIFIS